MARAGSWPYNMAVQHRSSNAADTVTAFACNQPASCANVPVRPSSDRVQPGGQAFKSPWLHRENVTYQDHRSAAADPRESATEQGNLMACLLPGGRMARDHPPVPAQPSNGARCLVEQDSRPLRV